MKKVLLLSLTTAMAVSSFAQNAANVIAEHNGIAAPVTLHSMSGSNALAKTTGTIDTIYGVPPMTGTITYYVYRNDSGYLYGMNLFGDKGFAQRYDFNGADSAVQVLGVVALFHGKFTANTTKTVTFNCWNIAAQNVISPTYPHRKNSGLPNTALASSAAMSIKNLGTNATMDTPKFYLFTTPTTVSTLNFFTGYTVAYSPTALAGDTVGLFSDTSGARTAPYYTVVAGDTIINNWNTIMSSAGAWEDATYFKSIFNDMYLYPILIVHHYNTGVTNITRKNFTFSGNYPNPAVNSTNIQFSLKTQVDVTVQVMDMSGSVVSTIVQSNQAPGDHTIEVSTAGMAPGNYVYVIHTSEGDGIGSQFTVIK